jgi:hypothetical protein
MKKLLVIVLMISSFCFAAEYGKIGLGTELHLSPNILMPSIGTINGRYMITPRFGADLGFGFSAMTGLDEDLETGVMEESGMFSWGLILSGVGVVYAGTNADLNLIASLKLLSFTNSIEVDIYDNDTALNQIAVKTEYYNTMNVGIFLGAEPNYYFSKHFSIYTKLGLDILFTGASKYQNPSQTITNNDRDEEVDLKKSEDSRTIISTGHSSNYGFIPISVIGMRWYW